jgi:putative DNA primase/helicase
MKSKERRAGADGIGLPEISFQKAMQNALGPIECHPVADGVIHRFHIPGDNPGRLNGWYVLYPGTITCGAFGSWKAGSSHSWSSRKPVDHFEAEQVRQRVERARAQNESAQRQRQQAASVYAQKMWSNAKAPESSHPYLTTKGIEAHNLRQLYNALLVPLYLGENLVNVQRIYPDGSKRFLSGGLVRGACAYLGDISSGATLYLCEGWATGATLYEHTACPVACAMNAGNLLEVGRRLASQHPDVELVVAGDDDRLTEGNPGRSAANHSAAALGCGLVFPPWGGDEPMELTDFNDLARWRSEQ